MSKYRFQYGRDLPRLLREGMFLSVIIAEIKELRVPIEQSLLLHNLYESTSLNDKKWTDRAITENLINLKQTLSPRVKRINEYITFANKLVKGLGFKDQIPKIKVSDVMMVIKKRLRTLFEVEEAQQMSNEHFQMSLGRILEKPGKAINDFLKTVDSEKYSDEINILNDPYREGLRQALGICSIGFYSTSVFVAGKTLEEVINDYFVELFRLKKTKSINLEETKFSDKIGKLYGLKELDESLYHKMSNIRIDRNEFGHPSKRTLSKTQAHIRIRTIAEVINQMQKKLNRLKARGS